MQQLLTLLQHLLSTPIGAVLAHSAYCLRSQTTHGNFLHWMASGIPIPPNITMQEDTMGLLEPHAVRGCKLEAARNCTCSI